ncbi:UDP-N-acetylmuramoyl-L-alanine--D-glutamate ligase [Jeotgalibacillus haloalkalitolerans]|uniref:UDP-N-acetylmuramoylalanine--D-glutamate ligase n=1 Tax=Jeotgalibacillus haloalkalitolerans TaxID=3104292 RepID=A0ABU5KKH1_9BACL|nr:UDP-N-acetylmuramoyl-L-alanine--D-glutamate ligase [Jeotgalibacillus sp. HH7-29]MDZ5711568.1 UDP-N-acetylmuramoyl-L-alanine--D-glutamate ligase [Jeotgalibacillus sp. HH7-29]
MIDYKGYQNKKVLVVGLAKSGVAASLLLHRLGAFVTVNDWKPLSENKDAQQLLDQGIKVICGSHPVELLDEGFELIVKNPGIPYNNPLIKGAIAKGLPVLTEVELAYHISEADIIGVTGTNGKTTTTTLIHEMITKDQKKSYAAGNIGTVACEVAQIAQPGEAMVIELSSFQLMGIRQFAPSISIITNIYDAHLDYHASKKEYVDAKAAITRNQTAEDYLIVNADQEELMAAVKHSKAQLNPFSTKRFLDKGISTDGEKIFMNGEAIVAMKDIVLPGRHNLENIMAAIGAAKLYGVSDESIRQVLTEFSGVKHRTQFVREWNNIKFYNDSKATNILATQSALDAFSSPTILLCGGLDRGNSFDELAESMSNVKTAVVFGETADKMADTAKHAGVEHIINVKDVEEAVFAAAEAAQSGDIVLLSPACASWDQYPTFEVRGDIFIDAVNKLK